MEAAAPAPCHQEIGVKVTQPHYVFDRPLLVFIYHIYMLPISQKYDREAYNKIIKTSNYKNTTIKRLI